MGSHVEVRKGQRRASGWVVGRQASFGSLPMGTVRRQTVHCLSGTASRCGPKRPPRSVLSVASRASQQRRRLERERAFADYFPRQAGNFSLAPDGMMHSLDESTPVQMRVHGEPGGAHHG